MTKYEMKQKIKLEEKLRTFKNRTLTKEEQWEYFELWQQLENLTQK